MTKSSTDPSTRRPRHVLRETALTLGALAGLVCVVAALASVVLGITPLVFRSGSMSPAIETGALALSKETSATELRDGDIVNVTNASGDGVTHRIVGIELPGAGNAVLTLKGDANDTADAESYVVEDARRVFFSMPGLGYAVTWLSGPVAVFAGGVLVGVLMMVAFRPSGRSGRVMKSHDEPESLGRHSKTTSTALLVIATVGALGVSTSNAPVALAAPLVDTSVATSGTITTALPPVPAPTGLRCDNVDSILGGLLSRTARLTWTTAGAGYTYQYTMRRTGTTDVIVPIVTSAATGTISTVITNGAILNLGALDGTYSFTVQTVSGTRVSATGPSWNIVLAPGLLGLLPSARCSPPSPAGAAARNAPQELAPPTTTNAPTTTTVPTTTTEPTTTSTTATTTTPPVEPPTAPPAAVEPPPVTTTTPPVPVTTTTPPAPADLISPQSSPSGSAVAKVVSVDGSPTLQITDSAGAVQYTGPISSSDEYGYGVVWASGDQLWLLGPSQLIRLDSAGSGWARSVVDPSATDEIPAEIAARLN